MMSLSEFIGNFSKEYSVHRLDDVRSGTFIRVVKGPVYLMHNAELVSDDSKSPIHLEGNKDGEKHS